MAERPSPSGASLGGRHLSAMQLFYELKQKFPTAPDPVVSECIRQSGQDPEKCEALLRASCASRGFLAAVAVDTTSGSTPSSLAGRRRRFSEPPAGVTPNSSIDVTSTTDNSRVRSSGRNSMCALAERVSTSSSTSSTCSSSSSNNSSSSTTTSSSSNNTSTSPVITTNQEENNTKVKCDNTTSSVRRSKLRPTFLNTRPPQGYISHGRFHEDLRRPPFKGGPLQEPHKCHYNLRRSSVRDLQHPEEFNCGETYKCSVTSEQKRSSAPPRVPEWSQHQQHEPTPPPRPPLPASMVQDQSYYEQQDYIQEVSVNCTAHGVHVTSTCSSPISSPVRHTASVNVHPTPHFLNRSEPRSYTSVNLTLRSPTSDPQPPIDIRSASKLTYSTSSYNPIQGFQSQLHIEIGAGCGTISSIRTQQQPSNINVTTSHNIPSSQQQQQSNHNVNNNNSGIGGGGGLTQHRVLVKTIAVPNNAADVTTTNKQQQVFSTAPQGETLHAGIARQMERKARLETELGRERERLRTMKTEVLALKDDLRRRKDLKAIVSLRGPALTSTQRAEQLRTDIKNLQEECKRMTQEVDVHGGSQVPLGETSEEFYQNIYTGQRGLFLPQGNISRPIEGPFAMPPSPSRSRRPAPPRPPAPTINTDEEEDGPHWTCSVCTFRNHPALGKCEQCEMPRISLDISEAETQDIHIRVTHSNFPSTRRVVHSWVV